VPGSAPSATVPTASGERLRVAMVIQRFRPYFSGQGVQVEGLCRALARRGVDCTVITARRVADGPVEGRSAPAREQADDYSVRRLRCDVPGFPFTARDTRWWTPVFGLRTYGALLGLRGAVDVIHVHGLTDGLYGAWRFARRARLPIVLELTLAGTDDPLAMRANPQRFQRWRRSMYDRCDGYVAMSAALASRYREAGLPIERLRVIPQGVDTVRFAPGDRRAARATLGLDGSSGPVAVFTGSLIERKGIDLLMRAWARIHAELPDARLLLVGKNRFPGEPEVEGALDAAFRALPEPAKASVLAVGLVPDVERYLQAADVFLFPSRREGFGTAIIEAMACGLPCVIGELPGISDFILERGAAQVSAAGGAPPPDGFVVPQESVERLSSVTLELLRSPALRASVGEAARARAATAFDMEQIAASYVAWYGMCRAAAQAA